MSLRAFVKQKDMPPGPPAIPPISGTRARSVSMEHLRKKYRKVFGMKTTVAYNHKEAWALYGEPKIGGVSRELAVEVDAGSASSGMSMVLGYGCRAICFPEA